MNNEHLLKQIGFEKEIKRIHEHRCPFCNKEIDAQTEFRDELSRKEFTISGMCQMCQDKMFGG